MSLDFCAARAVALGLILVSGFALQVRPVAAQTLAPIVSELEEWLDENSGLPRLEHLPSVQFSGPAGLDEIGGSTMSIGSRTRGLYDPATRTITLIEPWTPSDPIDVSVLLHELVHHRQPGIHEDCPSAQEPKAYRLQQKWLAAQKITLDVNWVAIGLRFGCRLHDVHP